MQVLEAIKIRRSVRKYSKQAIDPNAYQRIQEALRFAPSACNYQPWRFIMVQDEELRKQLAQACCKQTWMAEAPLTVAACGFSDQAYKKMGGYGNSIDVDLAIALDHLSLAAAAEGLGTCWIGAFEEEAVKEILNVPHEIKVSALMPVGYPKSKDLLFPVPDEKRKQADEIFSIDSF